MGQMRQIRQEALGLLEATKTALIFLRGQDPLPLASDESERQEVMAVLRAAIEKAEPHTFDESLSSIRLTMTHPSWRELLKIFDDLTSVEDRLVRNALVEGFRETKQRVYTTLSINPRILRRLKFIFLHMAPSNQDKAFKRLADQIAEDGLSKNPMEILGQMGL